MSDGIRWPEDIEACPTPPGLSTQSSWTEFGHLDMKIHELYGAPPPSGQKFVFSKRIERTDDVPIRSTWTPPPEKLEKIRKPRRLAAHLENHIVVRRNSVVDKKDKRLVIVPPESSNEHWIERRLKMYGADSGEDTATGESDTSTKDHKFQHGLRKDNRCSETTENLQGETDIQVDDSKTDDNSAREILLAQAADPDCVYKPSAKRIVIPPPAPLSDDAVYAYDMEHLPDVPTMDSYKSVPIESFGMGVLLGLGWTEGTDLKGQRLETTEQKRLPRHLGLGAKEDERETHGLRPSLKRIHRITGVEMSEDDNSGRSIRLRERDRSRGHEQKRRRSDRRRSEFRSVEMREQFRCPIREVIVID